MKTKELDLYDYIKNVQDNISNTLANVTDFEKSMILHDFAMWALKSIPKDFVTRSESKTAIIRSFFGRYKQIQKRS